jgi:hypothetical protein
LGLIFSLPTKMFLTFVLVKREAELRANEKASQLTPQDQTIEAVQKNSE